MSKPIHTHLLNASRERPHLNTLITQNGVLRLKKRHPDELFEYLCQTVVGQQLSTKAAETIWGRVLKLSEEKGKSLFDLLTPRNESTLRSCGVSGAKVKAMQGLRQAIKKLQLSDEIHSTKDAGLIIAEISALWGFGSWSAEMAALFFFAHPDIWSDKDAALARGLTLLSAQENCDREALLDSMRPYRSYFALHLWRGLDQGLL